MTWDLKTNLRGPAGADATDAAQDAQALADFANQTAGPNPFAAVLGSKYAKVLSVDAGFGNGSTDATAHIQSVVNAANAAGVGVYVPAGVYKVTAPLEDVHKMRLAEGAKISAGAAGMAAVVRTRIGSRHDNGYLTGKGVIAAGTNADIGVHLRNFLYYEVSGIEIQGGNAAGLKLGATASTGRSAEAIVSNVRIINPNAVTPAGRGILVENSGDHSFSQILIQNYEFGMTLPAAGNVIAHDVHVWTEPAKGATKVGFEDYSNNSHYAGCHADSPTEYGWRLYGYQTTLVQCGTFNNPAASTATDNVVVGVKFEGANAIATLVGHYFFGGSGAKRLKSDIEAADGKYGLIQHTGCSNQHVATARTLYNRSIGMNVRDEVSTTKGFIADAAAPINNLGVGIKTAGLDRWRIGTDGAAEAGGNAGTGFVIRRYDDAGALLSEPVFISRSSGTWVWKTSQSLGDGFNIAFGATTGTQLGTNAVQKLAFFGATPRVQPASTPPAGTDLATALTLLNDLRAKLISLGLIA